MWLPMPSECEPFLLHSGGSSTRSRSTGGARHQGAYTKGAAAHGQGGRQRHNGQRSFFFAKRSTTLERSVRSVTGLAGILSLNKCVMHGELTGTMRNACHDGACCGDVYVNLNNDLRVYPGPPRSAGHVSWVRLVYSGTLDVGVII